MVNEKVMKELIERNKDFWFVQHIERHLEEMKLDGKVCCKICDKDIDTIANERFIEEMKTLKKALPNLFSKSS